MKKVAKELIYSEENEKAFFEKINKLTDNNKFFACIESLESIPEEKRNYQIYYQLVRAYQNLAIIGEDDKGTDIELGTKLLDLSIKILERVRAEGENKAEWNKRMAYAYQYIGDQEERAISYALRWAELDPSDKDALLVVEECKVEIKNRVKRYMLSKVYKIVEKILKDHHISGLNDYVQRDDKELEEIDEKIHLATKDFTLDEEDIIDIIENVLEDIEVMLKNTEI